MHPISEILFRTYEQLLKKGQVTFPLEDVHKRALDSIVKTVNADYFGVGERFISEEDKALAYLVLIIKNHPLTDGNKRLSLLWFQLYCDALELKPQEPSFGYDALAVSIEQSEVMELDRIINILNVLLFPNQ